MTILSKSSMIMLVMLFVMVSQGQAVTTDVSGMPLAAIIISPLLLGFMFLIGALLLNPEEHGVMRIFFLLFAFMTYLISAWIGVIASVNYYQIADLETAIVTSVWVLGGILFVIISYFVIYGFYKSVQAAAQQREEMGLQ